MKNLLLFVILVCLVIFSYGQNANKTKEFPRFQKEDTKIDRSDAEAAFRKNLDMQPDDELTIQSSEKDMLDFTHDKFQQYYKKVKVEGAVYSVHSKNNTVENYSGEFKGIKDFDVTPAISVAQGLQAALKHVGARVYAWEKSAKADFPDYSYPAGELVIIGGAPDDNIDLTLAWKYDIYAADPLYRAEVFIDAKSGVYVKENQLLHNTNTASSGLTLYNGIRSFTSDYTGKLYRLRQTTSGGGIQTYSLKNGTSYSSAVDVTSASLSGWSDATAVQAHWGAEQTWAYYYNKFGRNSFNNAGAIIKSYVHYSKNYVNAFWDGSRMTYGDGDASQGYGPLVSLDICGHEITHGVTTYSANLNYSYESGALNESFSDIFGECIENYAKGTNDWMMSCDIGLKGSCGAFRNMMNPNEFGDPDTYKGTYWYTGTGDNGGVHYNSGVQNKWFYILTTGESGTNDKGYAYNVTGIGLDKASRIAYRNLTVYLTASSNYASARAGAIQSATDLYGAASAEVAATAEAWNAVGVYAPVPDTQAPSAPVLSTTSKTQNTIALSWTASTDNVGVTGYDVFVDGVKNNSSNLTTRTYTVSGLLAGTTYSIYVQAKDAAGNKSSSNTLSVTTQGTSTETLVKEYYFPSSLDGWTPSNTSNCAWSNNAAYAWEGNGSVMVRSGNTNATSPTLSLSGYTEVEVKFYFTAVGMEANKTFTLRYSSNNGSSWSTVATFTSASTASGTKFVTDNGFYMAIVTMNSTSFNATARFRIQSGGSNTTDIIYFDAVTVKGRTNTTGSGNSATLTAATKTVFGLKNASLNGDFSGSNGVTIYPNPAVSTLNITSAGTIHTVRVLSLGGSLMKLIPCASQKATIDISKLSGGVYIVEVVYNGGSSIHKIIKQ